MKRVLLTLSRAILRQCLIVTRVATNTTRISKWWALPYRGWGPPCFWHKLPIHLHSHVRSLPPIDLSYLAIHGDIDGDKSQQTGPHSGRLKKPSDLSLGSSCISNNKSPQSGRLKIAQRFIAGIELAYQTTKSRKVDD